MQTMFSIYSERLYWDDLRALGQGRANQVATAGLTATSRMATPFPSYG